MSAKQIHLLRNAITIVFLSIATFFLYKALSSSINKIKDLEFTIKWGWFFGSMSVYFAYFFVLASLWHFVTKLNKSSIPYREAIHCYALSVLGKYIPGEIFMLLARIPAYERRGVKARKVTINFYLENLGTLLGAAFLFLVSLFFFPNEILDGYKWVVVLVGVLMLVCMNPVIINKVLGLFERFFKGKDFKIPISFSQMLIVVLFFVGNWILVGSGFFMLVSSIYPIPLSQFLYVGGIFGLAVMVGMVTFFAPSGLGVREGILALGLSVIMPEEYALIISLVARAWATVAELIFILIVCIIGKKAKKVCTLDEVLKNGS